MVPADCGAGVGRVTEQLLLHHFANVDLIEPSKHLIGTAEQNLSAPGHGVYPAGHRAGQFLNMGLQAWTPEAGRCRTRLGSAIQQTARSAAHGWLVPYTHWLCLSLEPESDASHSDQSDAHLGGVTCCRYDVLWMQWALLYLTDGKVLSPINCETSLLRLATVLEECYEQNAC